MHFLHVFCLLAFVVCLHLELYSAIKIEITPKKILVDKDPTVKISCSLDDKEKSADEIMLMRIARKGGRVMVVLDPDGKFTYKEAEEDEVKPKGKIETGTDIAKSFLEMDILKPDKEDAGMYICAISYNDTAGKSKLNKAHAMLTVTAGDVNQMGDQVDKLLEQVKKEEGAIKDMELNEEKVKKLVPDLEKKTVDTENKIKDLISKETEFEDKVSAIEDKAVKQLKKIKELSQKEETMVKSLKSSVDSLLKKREKEKEAMKVITGMEKKVDDLEQEADKKKKDMEDLDDKEKKVEKKVNDLELSSKSALKKMKEFFNNKVIQEKKVAEVEDKVNEKGTQIVDLEMKEGDVEARMAELEEKVEQAIEDLEGANSAIGSAFVSEFGMEELEELEEEFNPYGDLGGGEKGADVMSAFSATNQEKMLNPKAAKDLVFSDVVMQAGMEGYNPNTGIYTAPVSGLYHFNLVIKVNCLRCYTVIAMMAYSNVIARLKTGTYYDEAQNSVSTVVQLNKGTEVKLAVEKVDPKSTILTSYRLCTFSGFLIKPVTTDDN